MDIKQEEVETIEEFLTRGGKIIYPKPRENSNYCKYCQTWNSIKKYYYAEYHYYMGDIVQTLVLQYTKCQCCDRIIKDYIKEDKDDK